MKTVLPKIKRYLRKNKKELDFEYEEDEYEIKYLFDDSNIFLFFDKYKNIKVLRSIFIGLPYEDILDDEKILEEIKGVMELKEKIEKLFYYQKLK